MIAWDIDGIFLPDIHFTTEEELKRILEFRSLNFKPIFEPSGDYYFITGRPISDKEFTLNWIDKFFKNPPKKVFHENRNIEFADFYKVDVLNANKDISCFIESSINQVNYIKSKVFGISVIHYKTLLEEFLNEKIYEL